MPTYEYQCEQCEHYFTKKLSIDERNTPEMEPCPECQEVQVKKVMFTAPSLGDPVRLGIKKPSDGFKDVLRKIHAQTPGSKLKDNSSFI